MLYDLEEVIAVGTELANKENLVFTGITIFGGELITLHLDAQNKGVELK